MNCKRRHRPEDAIRRAIVAHLTARAAPELWWRHVPNGGFSRLRARSKGLGLRKGAPETA